MPLFRVLSLPVPQQIPVPHNISHNGPAPSLPISPAYTSKIIHARTLLLFPSVFGHIVVV